MVAEAIENPLCVNRDRRSIFPILSFRAMRQSLLTSNRRLLSAWISRRASRHPTASPFASGWNTSPHRQQSRPVHLPRHQQLHRRARHAGGDRSRSRRRRPFRRAARAPSAGGRSATSSSATPIATIRRSPAGSRHSTGAHRLRGGAAPPCPAAAGSARSTRSTPAPTTNSVPDMWLADGERHRRRRLGDPHGPDARAHRQSRRLRARKAPASCSRPTM